jgi:hypothetical protein
MEMSRRAMLPTRARARPPPFINEYNVPSPRSRSRGAETRGMVDDSGSEDDWDVRVDETTQPGPDGRKGYCERDQYWDESRYCWKNVKTVEPDEKFKKLGRYVFVVLRVYTSRMILGSTVVKIKGAVLRAVLQNIFRAVEGFKLGGPSLSELNEPKFLYWAKPELLSLAQHFEKAKDDSSLFEIRAALTFIDKEFSTISSVLRDLLPNSISFEYLWAVLPPGSLVVGHDPLGVRSIWRVLSHRVSEDPYGEVVLLIQAEYLEWDGFDVGTVAQTLKIPKFPGTMLMQDLRFIPLKYHPERDEVINEIKDRSEKKLELCQEGAQHRQYDGTALWDTGVELAKFTCRSRIMIDPKKLTVEPLATGDVFVPIVNKVRKNARIWLSDLNITNEGYRQRVIETLATSLEQDGSDSISSDNDYAWPAPPVQIMHDRRSSSPRRTRPLHNGFDIMTTPSNRQATSLKKITQKLTEEDRLILSGLIYGFSFEDDKWGSLT